ncbi:MAG: hypothetical protein ACYS8W_09915 [Planctomycetota bacterium]|jgi:hypothetical protein
MTPRGFSQGIEKILVLAKLDDEFRSKLLANRQWAIENCDIKISDSERLILLNIPDAQLESAIENTDIPDPARRAFLSGATAVTVAAIAIATLGSSVLLSSCTSESSVSEAKVIAALRTISSTQEQFNSKHGRYGSLNELADENFIDSTIASGKCHGYSFEMFATEDTWYVNATPIDFGKTGGRGFYVDQTGVLRFTADGSAPINSSPSLGNGPDRPPKRR